MSVTLAHVVEIGCGGAGAATGYALLVSGARRIVLTDFDGERAHALAGRMRDSFPGQAVSTVAHARVGGIIPQASRVVHATPPGMAHRPGVAFDVCLLCPDA